MAALGYVTAQARPQSTAAGDQNHTRVGLLRRLLASPTPLTNLTLTNSNGSAVALAPEQSEKLNLAIQVFRTDRYSDALPILRELLPQLAPGTRPRQKLPSMQRKQPSI
jgi:hypothetical protein